MTAYHHFVSLETPDGPMATYVAAPEGQAPRPGVLVIQGMHGIASFELSVAERLAEAGFVAAVPDMFHRGPACFTNEELGQRRRGDVSDPQVHADVNTTLEFLQSRPYVDADRIGVVGFCMGGRVSYLVAATNPTIRAAADFYGGGIHRGEDGPAPIELTSNIRCPVIIFDGEEDEHPSPDEVRRTGAELARLGKVHEVHIYPEVGHGFLSATGPRRRAEAIDDAWSRLLGWFTQYVATEPVAAGRS
jgi:carboxymethylenebutenolidase